MSWFISILVLAATLIGCAASPAKPVAALPQPKGWKALLVSGDNQEPAFDNAVAEMAIKLEGFGVPRQNITMLKATARDRSAATLVHIQGALASLAPAPNQGCFVFITSHGAPRRGLVIKQDRGFLGPKALAAMLDRPCHDRPTVVIASGCYSGSFAEGKAMPAPNRVILTAARDDRPSFGCNAGRTLTVFDECLLDNLDRGATWRAAMEKVRRCVAANEQELEVDRPSSPQLSIGAAVRDLRVFAP